MQFVQRRANVPRSICAAAKAYDAKPPYRSNRTKECGQSDAAQTDHGVQIGTLRGRDSLDWLGQVSGICVVRSKGKGFGGW